MLRVARAVAALPLAAVVALTAVASPAFAAPGGHGRSPHLTVMTRNLYLGANLLPLTAAPPGAPFQHAAGAAFAHVRATHPNARMRLIAGEIANARPDLVGLQEVSLWRTGPKGDPAAATHVVYDYLAAIRAQLRRRHAHYRVVAVQRHFNIEGPTDRGVDVRLTLGDAVLVRRGVHVVGARSADFGNQLTIPTAALGPVTVTRGYNVVDAAVRGARLRFVNTHLEAYSPLVRLAQARELVAGPLRSPVETVLAGDLNSGPDLANPADRPPYQAIAAAGFAEERTPQPSCCFSDGLHSGRWDHNVDHIMARPALDLLRSSLTGRETTSEGLHPSDHGGVVSTMVLPRLTPYRHPQLAAGASSGTG